MVIPFLLSAFECKDNKTGIQFDSDAIYGSKATKHQIRPAFLYVAYIEKYKDSNYNAFLDYQEKHNMIIEKKGEKWILEIGSKEYEWDGKSDFVKFIVDNMM